MRQLGTAEDVREERRRVGVGRVLPFNKKPPVDLCVRWWENERSHHARVRASEGGLSFRRENVRGR